MAESRALAEWRQYWYLPLVAALGASSATLGIYGMGPFIKPLTEEFGWSRTEVMFGPFIAAMSGIVAGVIIGILVDRFGPRRLALIGITWVTLAIALLGTITGTQFDWIWHWALIAAGAALVMPTVWVSAVSTRFEASRGLALGLTLSGMTIGSSIFPPLGGWLVAHYGVRGGFSALGLIWLVLLLPLVFLFFRGANDGAEGRARKAAAASATESGVPAAPLPGLTLSEGLRGGAFYKLMIAGGVYSLVLVGLNVHLVPLLEDRGVQAMKAAWIASLLGYFSVTSRLVTGHLMDRIRPDLVGGAAFILPTIGCALLLLPGSDLIVQVTAVAILGLSIGGELGVVTYLSTRYFGMRSFGKLYGGVLIPMAIGTASGPLLAAAVFDHYKTYTPFLYLTITLMIVGGIALFSLGRPPVWEVTAAEPQAGS
jgi:MFS family permease